MMGRVLSEGLGFYPLPMRLIFLSAWEMYVVFGYGFLAESKYIPLFHIAFSQLL